MKIIMIIIIFRLYYYYYYFAELRAESSSFAIKYSPLQMKLLYVIAVYSGLFVIEKKCAALSLHFYCHSKVLCYITVYREKPFAYILMILQYLKIWKLIYITEVTCNFL